MLSSELSDVTSGDGSAMAVTGILSARKVPNMELLPVISQKLGPIYSSFPRCQFISRLDGATTPIERQHAPSSVMRLGSTKWSARLLISTRYNSSGYSRLALRNGSTSSKVSKYIVEIFGFRVAEAHVSNLRSAWSDM